MRPLLCRSILLLCVLNGSAAALATACGGSTASSPQRADSGAMDASNVDTGVRPIDSGVVVDSGMVDDGGACPVVSGSGTQATHGNPPVVSNLGGPVLHSPTVVTFTFKDTANAAALQAFGATIVSTPWFAEVLGDYAATPLPPAGLSVAIAANADPTYVDNGGIGLGGDAGAGSGTDLNGFMNQAIANAVAAKTIPAPDGNTVYMFYFPSTTNITGFVGPSCQAYGGYHFNQVYADGKTPIYYAVLPDCAAGSQYELQALTLAASHELVEAASDPAPNTGWSLDTSPYPDAGTTTPIEFRNDPWLSLGFGEIGDNCEGTVWTLDGGTLVQRIWSNSAAMGGHDPCVPAPAGQTYFNASPDRAIYVANVGDTFTVDVTPFTDVARPSWQLDAVDYSQQLAAMGGGGASYLQFEWVGGVLRSDGVASLTCVNSGTPAQLKVTLLAQPVVSQTSQSVQMWPQAVGAIYSVDLSQQTAMLPAQDTAAFVWPFEVITPATAAQIGVGSSGIADMARRRRFWEPVRRQGR